MEMITFSFVCMTWHDRRNLKRNSYVTYIDDEDNEQEKLIASHVDRSPVIYLTVRFLFQLIVRKRDLTERY